MTKVRDSHFDNIKAVLIFLVVLGHLLGRFDLSGQATVLYQIIFSFHMPAFIFISGYFAKFNPKKVFAEILPLYLIFQLLQIFEDYLGPLFEGEELSKLTVDIFTPKWTMWYLLALLIFQLLIPVFDTDNRKKQIGFLLVSLALGFMIGFVTGIGNFLAISRVFVFLPFYMLGYYEKKNGVLIAFVRNNKFKKMAKVLAAIIGTALVLLFCFCSDNITSSWLYGRDAYTSGASMIWRILQWGIAFLWIMILLIWVPKRPLGYIGTIGKNTLAIYLLHAQVILILIQTPLKNWIQSNMFILILTAVIITVGLSWNGFEKFIHKIRIPIKSKQGE